MMTQRSVRRFTVFAAAAALAIGSVGGCEKQVREARSTTSEAGTVASTADDAANAIDVRGNRDVASAATQPAGDPTVASAHLAASVEKAAVTQPVLATLMIEGVSTQFPPTKLRLKEKGGRTIAELFSDLPSSALRNYDGNELYFEMQLQNAEGGRLDKAMWSFKSTSSGKVDSPNGIFLNGQQAHLQPDDVRVTFSRSDGGDDTKPLVARIQGRFRMYASDTPDAAAPFVGVGGDLTVDAAPKK